MSIFKQLQPVIKIYNQLLKYTSVIKIYPKVIWLSINTIFT